MRSHEITASFTITAHASVVVQFTAPSRADSYAGGVCIEGLEDTIKYSVLLDAVLTHHALRIDGLNMDRAGTATILCV